MTFLDPVSIVKSGLEVEQMSGFKKREERVPFCGAIRIRTDLGWGDAKIHNVSSRGVMGTCHSPPMRGTYIEIRRGRYVIVGRVAWSSDNRFGIRAQDTIAIGALRAAIASPKTGERRRRSREEIADRYSTSKLTEISAGSARFARAFDFGAITITVVACAIMIADTASDVLAGPLESAGLAMSGASSSK